MAWRLFPPVKKGDSDTAKVVLTIQCRNWLWLILRSVPLGGSFFASAALRELSSLTIVLAGVVLAALLLLPVLWALAAPCHGAASTGSHSQPWAP